MLLKEFAHIYQVMYFVANAMNAQKHDKATKQFDLYGQNESSSINYE